jgi:L-fuconolactonase
MAKTVTPALSPTPVRPLERSGVPEVVDAQLHIWHADTPEHPWPKAEGMPPHKPYPVPAESLLLQMDLAGVQRAYLVPPSWQGDSNAVALDAARRYPDRFAVLGRIDLLGPRSPDLMAEWRNQPGMIGIRCLWHHPAQHQALAEGRLDPLFAAAAAADVRLTMMLIAAPNPAAQIARIAANHPALRISVDHLNLFEPRDLRETLPSLMSLAKYANVAMKASCLPRLSRQPYPFRDTHDALQMVFDHFGPQRMFWGSDLTRAACPYTHHITLFTEHLPWLRGADLDLVMGRAALEWYGWPAA